MGISFFSRGQQYYGVEMNMDNLTSVVFLVNYMALVNKGHKLTWEKQGAVTLRDRENEVSKIFITSC